MAISPIRARKASAKTNAAGRRLVRAVKELHRVVTTGDWSALTIREVEIPDPSEYAPREVQVLRHQIGVSQRVFAALLGVSPELVEHWEQGRRRPAPLARRLLDQIRKDPEQYARSLIRHRTVSRAS